MTAAGSSYEGVEDLSSFTSPDALADYRRQLLERTSAQSEFIAKRLERSPATAFEVACGNGRLLIDLAERAAIASGTGTDIAESRIAFARDWAAQLGRSELRFDVEDILASDLPESMADLAVCITGALGYFEPIGKGCAARVVRQLYSVLRPGGLAVLELYPHPRHLRLLQTTGGHARVWQELPAEDPWRFYLSELTLTGNTLTHEKTFIHRTDGRVDEGRREQLELYDERTADALVRAAGFEDVTCFEGWSDAPYAGGENLVVTARKPRDGSLG